MTKKFAFILIFVLSFCSAQQQKTSQDSINFFYNKLFYNLQRSYLDKNIDWKNVKFKTDQNLKNYKNFESSLAEIKNLFSTINATHSAVYFNNKVYNSGVKILSKEDFSSSGLKKYKSNPAFEVRLLDKNTGYIFIPQMSFSDRSYESLHLATQKMYDEVSKIRKSQNIKDWIVDLRLNTGGDASPMILALYDFLGNNAVWKTIDGDGKTLQMVKLSDGIYYSENAKSNYIKPVGTIDENAKIAVLIGKSTASSGEIVALTFKGRKNTKFLGNPTVGMTTANAIANLPFSAYATVSIGFDADRFGNYFKNITPDIIVTGNEDFENLANDDFVKSALLFFNN